LPASQEITANRKGSVDREQFGQHRPGNQPNSSDIYQTLPRYVPLPAKYERSFVSAAVYTLISAFEEAEVRSRVVEIANNLPTPSSIASFLTSVSDRKDNFVRLLAWLYSLSIVPFPDPDLCASLDGLASDYQALPASHQAGDDGPIQGPSAKDLETIESDVRRDFAWLVRTAGEFRLAR
jgi:hypothetical protein